MRSANALMTARNDRAVAVQIAHGGATKPGQIIKPAAIFNGPVIAHGKFLRPPASILHDDDRTIVFDDLVPHGHVLHPPEPAWKPQRPGVDVQTLGLGQLVVYAVPN